MARPGITQDQVFEAAEALAREGQSPTVVAVRSRLGGGSPNNITKWLSEWKAVNETQRSETLPALPDPVEKAMRQVWGAAWKAAQGQFEAERETLGSARKEIERERAEMLAEIGRLDGELEAARALARQAAEDLEMERRAHDQTRAEVREARAIAEEREKRIAAQEAELHDVRRQAENIGTKASRLEADLAHARADLEAARNEARQAAASRTELAQQIDGLKRNHAQASTDTERAQTELESAKRHAKEAKAVADAAGKKVQRLEAALEEERQARTAAEKALSELRVEAATLTERAAQADELRELLRGLSGRLPAQTLQQGDD